MKTFKLVGLLCCLAPIGVAMAETLVVDDQVQLRQSGVDRPKRGTTMQAVEQHFGAPAQKRATIGQPPITRWDYPSFSVFFEKDRVIHSVVTGG